MEAVRWTRRSGQGRQGADPRAGHGGPTSVVLGQWTGCFYVGHPSLMSENSCLRGGESGSDKAAQYGPVAIEVGGTILKPSHQHERKTGQP